MKRFYTTSIDGSTAILTGKERDHCIRVLRMQVGDEVELVNGSGDVHVAELKEADKQQARFHILRSTHHEALTVPDVAIAIPKNPSRWEFFLEKATEIGVGRIFPLLVTRSEKRRIREERNSQIIQSAFKQALHHYMPLLNEPIALQDLLQRKDDYHQLFIAHCASGETPYLGHVYQRREKSLIFIGPEGDFTTEEISLATETGCQPVSLGASRLRVETAGITVCNIIQCIESTSS